LIGGLKKKEREKINQPMIIFYAKPFQLRKQWLAFELLYESDISPWRNLKYLFASLGVELKSLNRRCETHARLPVSPHWTAYKYLQNIFKTSK